jgi:hypothetical protein
MSLLDLWRKSCGLLRASSLSESSFGESRGFKLSELVTLPPGADVGLFWSGCFVSLAEVEPLVEPFAIRVIGAESLLLACPPVATSDLNDSLLAGIRTLMVLGAPLELESFECSSGCACAEA